MFRRKQDVDRHVQRILGKIKDEREKQARGYQIAKLYFEVGEFEIARRYLASYLSVRDSVPLAYKLLGDIEEKFGNKLNALDAYKRFISTGGNEKEIVLKICKLNAEIDVDPEVCKVWLEKAERLFPQSDEVYKLKEKVEEKLLQSGSKEKNAESLEKLISSELVKRPHDVELRIKLLRHYLMNKPVDEAYNNAIETDRTTAFSTSLEWYECLYDVFRAYQRERDPQDDTTFLFHYLVVLCNLTYLRLRHKDVVESAEALHSFDRAMQTAISVRTTTEAWEAIITEMQGQLFFLAGTLLLKRAQKGSVSWTDVRPLAAVLYMLCQTVTTVDAQAIWYVRPQQDREKMYSWLYKMSFFRISQSGHSLHSLLQGDPASWAQRLQQQCCSPVGQERAYEMLFPLRDMRAGSKDSYLANTHKFCNSQLHVPTRRQLYDVDRVAHLFHPDQLSELVWLCLQRFSYDDPHQPDYNFKLFETLPYGVRNIENGAAETLCQLDTEAFLYATARCTARAMKQMLMSGEEDSNRPTMLPLCLCKLLCSREQQEWWMAAYNFCSNSIKDNFSRMRLVLQRGMEAVRLIGNHGLSCAMMVHLAKTFDAKVKSLVDGDYGNRASSSQLASLEARAALYWNHALFVLTRLERNHRGPKVLNPLFDDISDADLTPDDIAKLLQDAKFAAAKIAMNEGRHEEALKGFENLKTPYASFYRAQILKSLAQQALDGVGPEETKQHRYAALIAEARDALYLTLDHLGGNKNHELNILLTRELDDVESKLTSYTWENDNCNKMGLDETSVLRTPTRNGHFDNDHGHPHSTPNSQAPGKEARQRLNMSQFPADTPGPVPQRFSTTSPLPHPRPSPERMDAQIKSLNYSQTTLFKMVMDRNEELAVMYKSLVEELKETNPHLRKALHDSQDLMTDLKAELTAIKDVLKTGLADLAVVKETVRQLKEEPQAAAAASMTGSAAFVGGPGLPVSAQVASAGYLMGSPYHPAQAASYPPYGPVPNAPGYRYPLIPGYSAVPTPRAPAPVVASPRLSGTVPSSFGKFRENEVTSTEDDDDDEENIMSMLQQEYGEGLLQTPQYCFPSPDPLWQDLVTAGQGSLPYSSHTQTPPMPAAAMPQPGYFTSALRGQALQYTTGLNPNLPMPGPGFFSSTTTTASVPAAAVGQPAAVAALGGKPAATPPTMAAQPIPVIGAAAKPAMSAASDGGVLISEAVLYKESGKLTTQGGEYLVEASVVQNKTSKQGHIVVCKKSTGDVTCKHNIATVKFIQSFSANCFLWSVNAPDKKTDDLYKLSFDSPDQVVRLRAAIEQVIKTAGIKPVPQTPVLGAKSPGLPSPQAQADTKSPQPATATPTPSVFGGKASPASTTVANIFSSAKPTILASPPAPASTTLTPSAAAGAGVKATLGGFTFCTTPVVKQGEEPAKTVSPQLKLKESAIKVASPTAASATPTGSEGPKPFAGFTFTPSKPTAGAVVTTASETTKVSSSTGPTFVFGQASNSSPTFAALRAQATTAEAFKAKDVSGSGFKASNQPLFSQPATSPTVKSPGGKDDEAVEEYEPNVDFKPVIELPDLVEVKTGEENEKKVFADRVKLFRFDGDLNQWKERGVGELKILRAEDGARFRILMRRDQVLKVCANHYITLDMKLTPLATSDKAWCYTASDYAEQEMRVEKFAVKFKNSEKAGEFKTMFESCQKEIETAEKGGRASSVDKGEKPKLAVTGGQKSLAEMFKPAEGSWECPGCYVSNSGTDLRCVACQTLKPGAKADEATMPPKENPFAATSAASGFGGFKFGSEVVVAQSDVGGFKFGGGKPAAPVPASASVGGFKFGAVASSPVTQTPVKPAPAATPVKPAPAATPAKPAPAVEKTKGTGKSLAEMFKPSEGSWDCPTCLVVNKADLVQCPACQTTKPGASAQAVASAAKEDPFAPAATSGFGGFQFGATTNKQETTGFKFGGFAQKTETPKFTAPTPANSTVGESTPSGFKFNLGTPSSKPGFTFGTKATSVTTTAAAGFSFSPAAKESASATTTPSKDSAPVPPAGFTFPKPQASSTPAQPAKSAGNSALLQQLLTSEDTPAALKPAALKPADAPTKPGLLAPATPSSTAGFQFTFSKEKKLADPTSPKSPETDEQGFYLNKDGDDSHIYFEPVVPLPEKIEVKTGEEEEEVLFESRAKLYRFTSSEWKERGLGVIKILQHSQSGRIRVLMRREQVLKICCNHFITSDLDLKPMPRSDGKAWIWYAMDFTDGEGQMEQLAVRFRDEDTASKFKKVFDESKDKMKTPSKMDSPSAAPVVPTAADNTVSRKLFSEATSDDELQFLYEEKPTDDQVRRARELLLPDSFYLYENRPGCPGCIGCEDYDPSKVSAAAQKDHHRGASAKTQKAVENKEESADAPLAGFPFGGKSSLSFSSLAAASADGPGFGLKDSSKPFHWSGAGQKLFGQSGGAGAEATQEGEEGDVVSSEDVHFEPVIPLPALVEVKTGEEDWTTLFSHRAKVYRFDGTQWKERGIGEIKISRHTTRLMFRVLLRREQVLKIACNHLISPSMELKPMATSETSWCWVAEDYTEGQPKVEQFAVKFKNVEIAKEFKSVFEDCQKKLEQGESAEPVQETMVSSTQHVTGDRGNVRHIRALEASWTDTATSAVHPVTGDKGNPYYSHQLDTSTQDTMVSSTHPTTGDRGNPYMTQALDVAAQDTMVSTSTQPFSRRDEPNFSQLLSTDEGDADEQYGDYEVEEDDEEDDDDDDETDEDVEAVELEKRVTLYSNEGGEWKNLGMGDLRVLYDDDLNANKIDVITDSGNQLCNHVIYQELSVSLNPAEKCCEWHPLDYSTDEPVKRQFKAKFSSLQAAQEFEAIFLQGLQLAKESGISQIIPEEIDVPEVFSTGD